ncbi:hypothetical protein J5U23_01957 [Saccharolobus shibatae B12]|uniref:Uncharacterized protein n=1 Tax=Saccharolobus shibatae (strain ATCC 51178 / DSM 5389 / JCM 8931 / NBRC 15437 / B12) TaxID=523848 RepID=A0A8F5BPI0_SACSH|nr:hypothetical protein J5U23_01957 [Saccharolobus shibatae B12]
MLLLAEKFLSFAIHFLHVEENPTMNPRSNVRGRKGSMRPLVSWLGGMLPNLGTGGRTRGMRARG